MKNLKMFAIGLAAFAAMTMGVNALEVPSACNGKQFYITLDDSSYSCKDTLVDALNETKTKKGEIIFLKDFTTHAAQTITSDVVLNLNGHTLTLDTSKGITVNGANVTIKNGTLKDNTHSLLMVDSSTKASTLTIDKDVEVISTQTSNAFIKVLDATNETVVNINGKWDLKNEIIDCTSNDKKLTVNLNATVNGTLSTSSLVSIDAGTSVVNVLGGSYNTDKPVFELKKGTLNINEGTLKSTSSNTISVSGNDVKTLNIAGGKVIATHKGSYSIFFAGGSGTDKATYSISDGEFTSGKDDEGNQLPAININDKSFLENHANMISGGKFLGAIVDDVKVGEDVYQYATVASKALTGNATVTNEGGVVTVGTTATTEPEQQGPNTGDGTQTTDPGTTNPDVPNVPKTSDNILVYASLGVVSLVSVGFSTKRKENN